MASGRLGIVRGNSVDRPPGYAPEDGGDVANLMASLRRWVLRALEHDARLSQEKLALIITTTVNKVVAIVECCEREGVIRR